MTFPGWADKEFSQTIPGLRAQGEGSTLEFKEDFPEQAHNLAAEIAAFATSGGGSILIGIMNNGTVRGLSAVDADARDRLLQRAQGIVRTVKPHVKYDLKLGCDEGELILAIIIRKQEEPIFYYDSRPYIRDGSVSRPAEPGEVKERVWAHPSSEHRREQERILREMQENAVKASREADQLARIIRARWNKKASCGD